MKRRDPTLRPVDWILSLMLLATFAPALAALVREWLTLDYFSHGFFVPLVSLWAAAGLRARAASCPSARDSRGAVALAVSIGAYGVGLFASSVALQGVAAVAALASMLLWNRGPSVLRAFAFPVAYLLFMVPPPESVITPVIVRLQLWVSNAAVWVLREFGEPIFQDGNVIQLPGGESLFVAEACSGITSLITLLPIAVLLAYFTERLNSRRWVLVLAVVPLALLGNLIRVIGTVALASRAGTGAAATGPLHEWAGVLTYVLGCLGLLAIGAGMRRFWPAPEIDSFQ